MSGVKGYLHTCAGCGKREFVTAKEADDQEWRPGYMCLPEGWNDYTLPKGMVEMCPECSDRLAEACEELWKENANER